MLHELKAAASRITELRSQAAFHADPRIHVEVHHSLGMVLERLEVAMKTAAHAAAPDPEAPVSFAPVPTEPVVPEPDAPIAGGPDLYWLRVEALNAAKHCTTDAGKLLGVADDIYAWLKGELPQSTLTAAEQSAERARERRAMIRDALRPVMLMVQLAKTPHGRPPGDDVAIPFSMANKIVEVYDMLARIDTDAEKG